MEWKKILFSIILLGAVASGLVFAVRQNRSAEVSSTGLQVSASYYPLYDFARQVGGSAVAVTNMTPAGAEPHEYEPSPAALAAAARADVFIYNGSPLEPWTNGFVKGYTRTLVKASSGVPLASNEAGATSGTAVPDPHFWLDPVLAAQIVRNIRDGFIAADKAHAKLYTANTSRYIGKLAALDTAYRQGLQQCRQDTVVSSHAAMAYVAERYGFTVASVAGISPEQEPSASKLAKLSQLVREKHIGYIFFERLVSPRITDTIARETGAKTLAFDPLEGLADAAQKQGKDYLSIQYENLTNLRTALACQ